MSGVSLYKYLILASLFMVISFPIKAQNLLVNGDFQEGDIVGFDINGNGYNEINAPFSGTTSPGDFAFVNNPQVMNTNFFISGGDHTTGNGRMLAIDGNTVGGQQRFWRAGDGGSGICCLQVGTTYRFSYWVKSIATTVTGPSTQANIGIQINNANNITLTSGQTQVPLPDDGWQQVTYSFVATSNCVNIELWNNNTNPVGNDFAIDDMMLVSLDAPLAVTYSLIDINCPQDATGFIGMYPLGGVPPYVYTVTKPGFVDSNSTGFFEELLPGIYQVEIFDDVGNKISFTVEILVVEPELTISPNQVICFGETTTVQAFSEYEVTWTSNPVDNSIVELGDDTLQVTPTETTVYDAEIEYEVEVDLLYNGDFSEGNEGFQSDYQFLQTNPTGAQGTYGVVQNSSTWFNAFDDCSALVGDDFFAANGATDDSCGERVWCQTLSVLSGEECEFIYWIQSLNDVDDNPANIEVEINGVSIGQDLAPTTGCEWEERSYIWNGGGLVEICIYNREQAAIGNDFGIDNIQFLTTQTCIENRRVRVQVDNCFCPEIENPQGSQTICQDEALAPISADVVLENSENEISFVYFTTPQVGNQMYQNGILLNQQLTSATATYDFPPLGQPNSLPNIPGTYYVYAILSNPPPNPNCRPFAEIVITIEQLFIPIFTDTIPDQVCEINPFTLPNFSENDIEGTWSPSNEVLTTGTYTFTPIGDICFETFETEIVVIPDEIPEFDLPSSICSDGFINFPTVSDNGYQGSWSPAFNPNEETTYTFTPIAGECSTQTYSTTIPIIEIVYNDELTPLEECDNNNNGFFAGFDLESRIDEVTFSNPELEVSFHLTESDAIIDMNPVESPYSNVNPSQQTLYVRVEYPENNCFKVTTLDLIVYDSPLLEEIPPFIGCDIFQIGTQFFDLTSVEENLFVEGQDTTDFEISYHISENAALNNIGIIQNSTNYQIQINPQILYVRVSDPNSPIGCFNIQAIELIVEALPEITHPTLIAKCDDFESGSPLDQTSTFDLSQKIPEITNDDEALEVVFYASEIDQENDNPIANTEAYQNITNPQNLQITVFSPNTECVATTNLTLIVDPLPTIPMPDPLIVCDADNEGTSEFDLLAAVEVILEGEVNTQITYHLTEIDASLGENPIEIEDADGNSILFQNFNPFTQTLYVRAENIGNADINGTGCFVVLPLELEVRDSPLIENLEDLVICDDESLNGFALFDLTQNTSNAIGSQDASIINVTYYETQANAEAGVGAIAFPSFYTNLTNPQSIFVRFEDMDTQCIDLFGFENDNSFTISVEPYPELTAPATYKVCNTRANADVSFPTGNFDLSSKEEEMTGLSPVPANITFAYYENQTDFDNQQNAIEDPTNYINSNNPPMLIFVEATNTDSENLCTNNTTLTIDVLPFPFPVELTPEERRLIACDNDNDGIAIDPFDLTEIGQQITGNENNVGSYYLTEDAAIDQDIAQQIADPTAYINEPALNELDEDFFPTNTQIIWVRLDSNAAGNFCYVIVPIELVVEPNPEINPAGIPFGYTLCEGDPTQLPTVEEMIFGLYDASLGSPNEIIPVLDPANESQNQADYEYTFHLTEADAEAGINFLAPGYQATDGQILYLRVTHILTGCYNIGNIAEVQITIESRPEITDTDLFPIVVCADEQADDAAQADNQEVATIDLTQRDADIDPNFEDPDSNTLVEYYASEEDFINGIPIQDPANFVTSQTPMIIFAQVIDLDNFCSSFSAQSFEIQVNPLPLVDISDMDGAIICINPETGEVISTDFSPPVLDTQLSEEFYNFDWTLNGNPIAFNGSSYTVDAPGLYTVTVTDITNNITSCLASSSAEIIQSTGPSFEVNVLSLAFDGSHSIEVTNIQGDGEYEFQVDNGPWQMLEAGQTSIIFSGLEAGEHIVRGRDLGRCGQTIVSVFLIDYPRFFTPNEDGYNDTWNIIGLENQPNAKIHIFDRFGKLLKQLSPSGPGWDGNFNGSPMIGNDYWFSVQYIDPSSGVQKEFRANITLKR